MISKYTWAAACMVLGMSCSRAVAQGSYTLYDSNGAMPHVFTNSLGTASTNGTMIVFEGALESLISVSNAYNLTSDKYLASIQLLTQVRLFDELPASNEVGAVQGAVAALRNTPGSSNGTYYVWAVTNAGLTGWTPLLSTNQPPATFPVFDGETNYITFVFNYPTNSDPVTYRVFLGELNDQYMTPSATVVSPTDETNGINSVSLLGMGGLMEVGTASGATGPLSASVDFSVYASTNGSFRVEINTVDEEGRGTITVYALIDGVWTPIGSVVAIGSGSNRYFLTVNGLEVGKSYWFKIVDEAGHTHSSPSAIEVRDLKMEAVTMTIDAMQVTFNTESGRKYQVKVSADLSAPIDQWAVEDVSVYLANQNPGGWSVYSKAPFLAGSGPQTVIKVPLSKSKAFFKIVLFDEPLQ